jgi:hypothetical protein
MEVGRFSGVPEAFVSRIRERWPQVRVDELGELVRVHSALQDRWNSGLSEGGAEGMRMLQELWTWAECVVSDVPPFERLRARITIVAGLVDLLPAGHGDRGAGDAGVDSLLRGE